MMRRLASFLLVLFAIAALLRVHFFFTILYFLVAVYLLSRLWSDRMMAPLRVQRRFTERPLEHGGVERTFFGDDVSVELTVHNTGWLPLPWLEIHESLPVQLIAPPFHRQVVSLGPREKRHFHYALTGRRRGYYVIGPLRMRGGGMLGIHPPVSAEIGPNYLVVYPQILPLQRLGLPTRSPLVALPARIPLFEDPSCVIGVRDYERGDSPRRIHWTATASAGRLLVKQYRPSIARETLICLDLDAGGYEPDYRFTAPELAIIVAASVANHIAVQDRLPVGLATEGEDPLLMDEEHPHAHYPPTRFFFPPRPGRGHLISLLEVLARVQPTAAVPFAELLRRESVNLSWGATLVVVTGRESEPLFDTLVYLRRAGFAVALILIQPGRPSDELRQRADLMGVAVHRVWREGDLRKGFGVSQGNRWQ